MNKELIKIIKEILNYKWEPTDNKHTVETMILMWVRKIEKAVRDNSLELHHKLIESYKKGPK